MNSYDCVIIGAGPAGLTAGIYVSRGGFKTLILEKLAAGGQVLLTSEIENYPGFPGGVKSFELMERMEAQAKSFGVVLEYKEAEKIRVESPEDPLKRAFILNDEIKSRSLIIASGAGPKRLNVPKEDEFIGRGVSYCATCDGPLYRGREVAVVGGGDKAVEEALFLSRLAGKVTLIHRRSEFRAANILRERLKEAQNVALVLESVVEEISGDKAVRGLKLRGVKSRELFEISVDGVFIFIGINPNTGFLKGVLSLDDGGFITADERMRTPLEGMFACGDCRRKDLYQLVTACGDGASAGFSAVKYLELLKKS